jgi:hypothetical protein
VSGVAAYPGSFNPPTIAHVGIAEAVRERHRLDRVDLIVSRLALGKERPVGPSLEERITVLEALVARVEWLGLVVTDRQLIADLAEGYDVVVMGADKWAQVQDVAFYGGSEDERDRAVGRLPVVAVVPRPPHEVPDELRLEVPAHLVDVSSTLARSGRHDLMVTEAAELDRATGAWTRRG